MKHKYQLPVLTREQRMYMYYLLHGEIDKQHWFSIVRLRLWNSEGIICTQ